jgi:hypothetical protein
VGAELCRAGQRPVPRRDAQAGQADLIADLIALGRVEVENG